MIFAVKILAVVKFALTMLVVPETIRDVIFPVIIFAFVAEIVPPINPVDAVIVVPETVEPWKDPPVNPVDAVIVVPEIVEP